MIAPKDKQGEEERPRKPTKRLSAIGLQLADLVFGRRCAMCSVDLPETQVLPLRLCHGCESQLCLPLPPLCPKCGSRYPQGQTPAEDCSRCRKRKLPFREMVCLGMYDGKLREAILKAKHARNQPLAAALAELLYNKRREKLLSLECDLVVPIPMHWRRRWLRGVNHTETQAAELGARLGLPVKHALRRVIATEPQGGLSASARRKNIRGAFRKRFRFKVKDARILLVDDIVTTGATCTEAARSLRRAGAASVDIAVISRADRPIPVPRNRL